MLKQIEILQSGFLEGVEGEDSEDCSDSFSSFGNEEREKPSRSVSSLCRREIDFSDVNELFNRTRTKSLENETYEEFLSVMQHFCLIPGNEAGRRIWRKLREVLQETVGMGKEGREKGVGLLRFCIRKSSEPWEIEEDGTESGGPP